MLDIPFKRSPAESLTIAELSSPPDGSLWKLSPSREQLLVIAFVGLQIAILVLMIVLDGMPLVLGQRLRLKVVPVDPRDMFRGDYVVLDYGFNRMGQPAGPAAGQPWDGSDASDNEVYVGLKQEGDHYVAESAHRAPPSSGPYIRGTIDWSGRISCGIEAYYVQQGEGQRLEQAI